MPIGTDGYNLRHYSLNCISVKHITGALQQMRSDGVPHVSNGFQLLKSNLLEYYNDNDVKQTSRAAIRFS